MERRLVTLLGMLTLLGVGCSSGTDEVPTTDTGVVDSSAGDGDATRPDTRPPPDIGIDVDASETGGHGGTTGKACTTSDECDVTGDGVNQCSADWFAYGSLYPNPVCIGTSCEVGGEPGKIYSCDEGKGWCLDYTTSTRCYPKCTFSTSNDTAPVGCLGKDACNWYGWTSDSTGATVATGYCFGGCVADADCPTGLKCQREVGECYRASRIWTATKALGDPCTPADDATSSSPPKCECFRNAKVGKGYCTMFCRMGEPTDCPTGFTCDAQLPTLGSLGDFTAAAKGLAGACLKNCTDDTECEPLGGFCDERAGTGRKTCQFGVRSGSSDAGTDAVSGG